VGLRRPEQERGPVRWGSLSVDFRGIPQDPGQNAGGGSGGGRMADSDGRRADIRSADPHRAAGRAPNQRQVVIV